MAFIPWPNGVQLCFHFTTAGQNWEFCLALKKDSGAPTTSDLGTLANDAKSWWTSNLKHHLQEATLLNETQATDMTSEGAPDAVVTSGEAATDVGNPAPLNAAMVLSNRTAKRGRSYRGRTYVGGLIANSMASPVDYGASAISQLLTDFAALEAQLNTDGFTWVVPSKQHDGVVTNPAHLEPVIAHTMDAHIDSQRRRLFGRGT